MVPNFFASWKLQCQFALTLLMLVFGTATARAYTESTSVDGGTLSWTVTESSGTCGEYRLQYTEWSLTSFQFVYGSTTYSLGAGAAYFNSPGTSEGCPPNGPEPTMEPITLPAALGNDCVIDFTPEYQGTGQASFAGCQVAGYINPRFVVLGVTYVPPGPQSYVQYCDNTTVSDTSSITNTFLSSFQAGVKVEVSASLFGFLTGSTTGSSSDTYSQTSTGTNSVMVSQMTSLCTKTMGAALGAGNVVQPSNHDYDVIWLWLNPVVLLTFQTNSSGSVSGITWNGYGYAAADQPAMDVYPVYVGCLNGDLTAANGCELSRLSRPWAASETWPSGQGPALTSTDYSTILSLDPYAECTPHPTECPTSPNPDRFTITDNESVPFEQPPIYGQPITETFAETYTKSDTQSEGYTKSDSVTFGLEAEYGGSIFGTGVKTTFSNSDTFTWTNQINNSLTNTNSTTATASVTGPTCTVSGSSCNPTYTGPTEFDLYEDNFYGTFYFNPEN